jgi:predicted AAA+ superfamily ATPase
VFQKISRIFGLADRLEYKLYFWRHNGNEVDFILQSSKKLVAIEVKSGRRLNNQGLPLFSEQFHPDVELVVGGEAFSTEQFLSLDLEHLLE